VKKRYAMAVDTRRCVGCNACVISCKTENAVPDGGFRDWIATEVNGTFPTLSMEIRSERCNHCSVAPCVDACPTGASHVQEGGVVMVNEKKCTGCKACITSCAYGARYVHSSGYVDKCTFCLHRVNKEQQPACVEVCPTRTLTFGDRNDPDSAVSRLIRSRKVKVLQPETGNEPNVFFLS
jgi:Fe-S-cluster-containing dehydrogenase component